MARHNYSLRNHLFRALIAFLFTNGVFAQDSTYTITGRIFNLTTGNFVPNASIKIAGTQYGTQADKSGSFKLNTTKTQATLIISSVGFKTEVRQLKQPYTFIKIDLKPKALELSVSVTADRTEKVFNHQKHNVIDFEFLENYFVILMHKPGNKSSLLYLINQAHDTLSSILVPEKGLQFFRDCMGNIHLTGAQNTYQLYLNDSLKLEYLPAQKTSEMQKIVFPCVANFNNHLVFYQKEVARKKEVGGLDFKTGSRSILYYTINKQTKVRKNITHLYDANTAKILNESNAMMARKQASGMYNRPGIGYSAGAAAMDQITVQTLFDKDIYAPVFTVNDTLILFNFQEKLIEFWSEDGKKLGQTKINYELEADWKPELYQDRKTQKIYQAYTSKGIKKLNEINLYTGSTLYSTTIKYPYCEKIIPFNNEIYFLYKELNDGENRYLYKVH